MENKHDNMVKSFVQLSKAWYGKFNLGESDCIDEVTFGFYAPEGETSGEMAMKWIDLSGEIVPKLVVFSDGWSALSNFHDLIDLLGQHDNEDPTPEEFCNLLLQCGFVDKTEPTNPY